MIGHRGASGYRPEHTRSAFELAFALGADAVEPDLVATRDGVLVIRHENEISSTTDVAAHPEFADRRTTREIDGRRLSGWFTEDFTWEELTTLRAVERLPDLRPGSAAYDGNEPILRLEDLLEIVEEQSERAGRELVLVAEIKNATYFASIGLPLDELFASASAGWATPSNLIVESFEQTVLTRLRARGVPGRMVFLAESSGAPADLVARFGSTARSYTEHLTAAGLAALAGGADRGGAGPDVVGPDGVRMDGVRMDFARVDGVSVDKSTLLVEDASGEATGESALVERAHAAGLSVSAWTLRAENRFLHPAFRRGSVPREYGDWLGEFRAVIGTGVDAVFADQPDLVLAALAG